MLRFLTAGESHGPKLTTIIQGVPAGLDLTPADINRELARRQLGFGRGRRMKIESDQVRIVAGVRLGKTLGSPVALEIENRDWQSWQETMAAEPGPAPAAVDKPRPGHADLSGILKTGQADIRNVLERASARETAARVAAGALAKKLLESLGMRILSHVIQIGDVKTGGLPNGFSEFSGVDSSPVRCLDPDTGAQMVEAIKKAAGEGDTLGGIFEVLVFGCPPGIGGYAQWDERLNANLGRALLSIPAIKSVEVGDGRDLAALKGSQCHDEIFFHPKRGFFRETNHAGGIEGGMSNGETIRLRAAMKPIPTLGSPLRTVNLATKEPALAHKERSDICAVPSAGVIGEAVVALELAGWVMAKFGGDSMAELRRNFEEYKARIGQ